MNENQRSVSYYSIESSLFFGTALVSFLLCVVFRLPLLIRGGAAALGYLNLSLILYLAFLFLSAFALPVSVARLVSARMERKHPADAVRVLRSMIIAATALGAVLTLFFWLLGPWIARLTGISYSGRSLRLMGPALWLMSYLGLMRGYYLGRGSTLLVSLSVVLEQICGGIASLILSAFFIRYGEKAELLYGQAGYVAAYGAEATALSFSLGAVLTLIFLWILSRLGGGVIQEANEGRRMESLESVHRSIQRNVIPAASTVLLLGSIFLFDNLIFTPKAASIYGEGLETAKILGSFSGMLLCFSIPVFGVCGLFCGILPGLRIAALQKNGKLLRRRAKSAMKFSFLFALFCFVLLFVFSRNLSNLFFAGEDTHLMQGLLQYGSVFVLFMAPAMAKCGVLWGLGHFIEPVKNALMALLAHLLVLVLAMVILKLEMFAVLLACLVSAGIFWLLNTLTLMYCLHLRRDLRRGLILPVLCAALSGLLLYALLYLLGLLLPEAIYNSRILSGLLLVLLTIADFALYLLSLAFTGAIRREELTDMPFGLFLYRFAAGAGLM